MHKIKKVYVTNRTMYTGVIQGPNNSKVSLAKKHNPTIGKTYSGLFVYIKPGYCMLKNRCIAM